MSNCALTKHGANYQSWWDGPDRYKNINRCEVSMIQRDVFFQMVEIFAGGTGLDIGCGSQRFGGTLGIDIKQPCDIIARGENLPIKSMSVNYVISCHSLEHIPDTEKTLNEWMCLLKPCGILAVIMPDKNHFLHEPSVTKDGEVARHESTPQEIFTILKKMPCSKILLFNTRNNNFDFEFIIRKDG